MLPAQGAGDFYPRSPRGERHRGPVADRRHPLISIHAPREGSDGKNDGGRAGDCNFYPRSPRGERPTDWLLTGSILDISIHAPREGSDASWYASTPATQIFLSTLPARGATRCAPTRTHRARYFYPRSPRGERHFTPRKRLRPKRFLSTLPARGATKGGYHNGQRLLPISIHAPREGSDIQKEVKNDEHQ